MPGNDADPSDAVETYLRRIIDDDIDKKSGIYLSSFYTELSAVLSIEDILPFTLRVIEKDEDRQHEYEILELVEKEKNLIISGISGSGKTTTLRWLNVILAKKFLEEKNGLIPVLVELNSYVRGTFYDYARICLLRVILHPYLRDIVWVKLKSRHAGAFCICYIFSYR